MEAWLRNTAYKRDPLLKRNVKEVVIYPLSENIYLFYGDSYRLLTSAVSSFVSFVDPRLILYS